MAYEQSNTIIAYQPTRSNASAGASTYSCINKQLCSRLGASDSGHVDDLGQRAGCVIADCGHCDVMP